MAVETTAVYSTGV